MCYIDICLLVIAHKNDNGNDNSTLSPEIEIRVKVYMCSRCGHLWERRRKGAEGLPITCPNCNSPYWNTGGKSEKKLLPLRFHGEEVLDSNFDEVYGKGKESRKK
jgi:DNA-directed RNA polymerase subunit RPC12/RpoP